VPVVAPRALLIIPAALVALVAFVLTVFVVDWWLALLIAVLAGALAAVVLDRVATSLAVGGIGGAPLEPGSEPRFESVVENLCATAGVADPELRVLESRAVDIAAVGGSGTVTLVVTTGALRQLDRLELEAVTARQLAVANDGTLLESATMLAAVGRVLGPLGKPLRDRFLDDRRAAAADIDGVNLTRYPPALASALQKCREPGVPDVAAVRHLWLIGPAGVADAAQPPLDERIDTLKEL